MNNGNCSDNCTNTVGSFICSCDGTKGYEIGPDNKTCIGQSSVSLLYFLVLLYYCCT